MFDIGTPTPLFEVRANSMNPVLGSYFYSVSVDSQRFLIDHIDVTADPVLNMVVNWERAVAVSK
jgi:hypothetical protein